MKILFFYGGKMGDLARGVLEGIEGVEIVDAVRRTRSLTVKQIKEMGIDLVFSASYPGRIEQDVCRAAALGAVNIHTGLLPEGRGSNPLNWAIIWGKEKTGITIHKIVDSYDAGDICLQHEVPIFDTDTIVKLRERVEMDFPQVIAAFFEDPKMYLNYATKQNQAHMSYAQKRRKEDSELNTLASQREQYNLWRSCHPTEYPCFMWRYGLKYVVVNGRMDGGIFRYELELHDH